MTAAYERTTAAMGTVVSVMLVGGDPADHAYRAQRALEWFSRVEAVCSRFDESSELRQLCTHVNEAVPVSDLLFECVRVALEAARVSDGAFDPTVGAIGEARGFDRHWRTQERVIRHGAAHANTTDSELRATWRDVILDELHRTVTLRAPLLLDLGALAKGLAIDLAAHDLADVGDFAIDAGGDLFLSGANVEGESWLVGVRHPEQRDALLAQLRVRDVAVCTSGDYERRPSEGNATHLIGSHGNALSDSRVVSATVVGANAMVADALATAAYVLGPVRGIELLQQQGVEGLIVCAKPATHGVTNATAPSSLSHHSTPGMAQYLAVPSLDRTAVRDEAHDPGSGARHVG